MSRRTITDCDICGAAIEIENTAKPLGERTERVIQVEFNDVRREVCQGCFGKHFASVPWKRPISPCP